MKREIKILGIVSAFVFLLLSFFQPTVMAQDDISTVPARGPYQDDISSSRNINTTITIDSRIGKDNYEDAVYEITIENPLNQSVDFELSANFPYAPENIALRVNGETQDFNIGYRSDAQRDIRYSNKYSLPAFESMVIEIEYERLIVPNSYSLGLWGIEYNYARLVNINYQPSSPQAKGIDFYQNTFYEGTVEISYDTKNLRCNGCTFDPRENVVKIDNNSWFSISWEKPRTPVVSSIVYVILVLSILFFVVRARKR